jgi:hypothetical protein
MTTPDERARSLRRAWDLLMELAYGHNRLVRQELRNEARVILRHYPHEDTVSPGDCWPPREQP